MKASSGPRYVVGCRRKVNKAKLTAGARVALDMTTLTIMRVLPREVDPMVYTMINQEPGKITYSDIGGLSDQIRELREVIELPLTNPELFVRVGIKPPKGVLLYGPPGTGKTLLARALATNINATYLKLVASAIVDKYIGESARVVREMFGTLLNVLQQGFPLIRILTSPFMVQAMRRSTSRASSSWMRSMPLVDVVSRRAHQQIEKCNER